MLEKFAGQIESGSREDVLLRQLDAARLPRHIAVIMDGNGRWAKNVFCPASPAIALASNQSALPLTPARASALKPSRFTPFRLRTGSVRPLKSKR